MPPSYPHVSGATTHRGSNPPAVVVSAALQMLRDRINAEEA
jgi:hypothetical protein